MSNGPILNPTAIQALRELSPEGGSEFLRELIAIYLTDTPKLLAQVEEALARQDAGVAARAAHTMKGSSANFGAEQFSRLAQEIEAACKANNLSAAALLLPEFKRHYIQVVAALEQTVAHI